jgi:hypothetical protein
MRTSDTLLRRTGIAIVLLHALVGVVHSAAHSALHIYLSSWQHAYIFVVIIAVPLVAGILLWRRSGKGFLLLFISMLGSLLFGGYYHFVLPGPDNVSSLMAHPWTFPFQASAVLLAVTEAVGVVVGLIGILNRDQRL